MHAPALGKAPERKEGNLCKAGKPCYKKFKGIAKFIYERTPSDDRRLRSEPLREGSRCPHSKREPA